MRVLKIYKDYKFADIIVFANKIFEALHIPYGKALSLARRSREFLELLHLHNIDPMESANLEVEEYEETLLLDALKSICALEIRYAAVQGAYVGHKQAGARSDFIKEVMRPAVDTENWHKLLPADFEDLSNIEYIEARSLQEEAFVISLKVKEALGKGAKRIGIVADNSSLLKRLNVLIPDVDVERVLMSQRCGKSFVQSMHMNLINLLLCAVEENFAPLALLALLKHCCFNKPISISHLEMKYLRGIKMYEGLKGLISIILPQDQEIRNFLEELLGKIADLSEIMENDERSLKDTLKILFNTLNLLISPDAWLGEEGSQFKSHLDEISNIAFKDCRINPKKELKQILHQLIDCRFFETKQMTMSFDTVIISCSARDELQPSIDSYLAKRLGVDTCDENLETISALMHCNCVLITRSESVNANSQRPPGWLSRLEVVASQIKKIDQIKPKNHYLLDAARNLYRPTHMIKYELPKPTPPLSIRPRDFSVTQIEKLIRDPYSIYASKILKLSKLDVIDMQPNQATFGNIIHQVLDEFNKIYDKSKNHSMVLQLLYNSALNSIYCSPTIRKFWDKRFAKIAKWILEFERERMVKSGIEVYTETRGSITLQTKGSKVFSLSAKADRIESADSSVTIFDFKTGSLPTKLDIEKDFSPQLNLEGLIAALGGFSFRVICVKDLAYIRLGKAKFGDLHMFSPKSMSDLMADLTRLISAYLDDENTPYLICPNKKKAPMYNDFSQLERIQEI